MQTVNVSFGPCTSGACSIMAPATALPSFLAAVPQHQEGFARLWSNSTQWPGRVMPSAGQDVVIPSSWDLYLDEAPAPMGVLTIAGRLTFQESK